MQSSPSSFRSIQISGFAMQKSKYSSPFITSSGLSVSFAGNASSGKTTTRCTTSGYAILQAAHGGEHGRDHEKPRRLSVNTGT